MIKLGLLNITSESLIANDMISDYNQDVCLTETWLKPNNYIT